MGVLRLVWGLGLGLSLGVAGCEELETTCLDDFDGDGLCGDADLCPVDAANDADGDGLCAQEDACLLGPDDEDADGDGVPDACDVCPADVLNDADADGICGAEDLCPDVPGTSCDRVITVGLKTDAFPEEGRFDIYAGTDQLLASGTFAKPGQGVILDVSVPTDKGSLCVHAEDEFGDGGLTGFVFDGHREKTLLTWERRDYGAGGWFCAPILAGQPKGEDLPVDVASWLEGWEPCTLQLTTTTALYGNEVYWTVLNGRREVLLRTSPGDFASYGERVQHLEVYSGAYTLEARDTWGDGWNGGDIHITHPGGDDAVFQGTLPYGAFGEFPFVVSCEE